MEVAKVTILYRLLSFSIMAGVSIYFFWLYATHHKRHCEHRIALWLLVTAATAMGTFILEVVITFACISYRIKNGDASEEKLKEEYVHFYTTHSNAYYHTPIILSHSEYYASILKCVATILSANPLG